MNKTAWIIQGFLAAVFLFHGFILINPPEAMQARFTELPFSQSFMTFIGIAELLGAVGLILPKALNILPFLTTLAAAGLGVIMLGAVGTHVIQGDIAGALPTFILTLLCAFVVYLRSRKSARAVQPVNA